MSSRNRSIRFKIFLLLLLPLLVLSAMWGFVLKVTMGDVVSLFRANTLYEAIGVTSADLGLELQAERAITVRLLSSGQTGSNELAAQQTKTTAAMEKFTSAARDPSTRDAMSGELLTSVDSLLAQLDRLPSIRESVTLGRFDRLQTLDAYNGLLDQLFALYERLVALPDLDIYRQAAAMQGMGNAYEMIAREDTLIRGALVSGVLTDAERSRLSDWVATRRFLVEKNRPILAGAMREPYEEVLSSSVFTRFTELETQILTGVRAGGELPDAAQNWAGTVDSLLSRLDQARTRASEALTKEATSVATGIVTRLAIAGGLGLVAIVATILFSARFGRRLTGELTDLRNAALDLAEVRLPRLVERLRRGEEIDACAEAPPIKVNGPAEIEDLAHAFSTVQRTAVESAVGEAHLRRGINQVFLNIARRKQSLLQRQLKLLDAMQRRTEDPQLLEDLFQLDHLTTRMRRHEENLIVLSGAPPGRTWRKPVPFIDVVRGALAEVEDYRRITLGPIPEAALRGESVADLVHLLAELLENATVYSPPSTRVDVRGEIVANGLVVEIEDRGLGLSAEEYAEINRRLADPPEFDPAGSDRLGLFVVGRLAARHGVQVVLRGSPYGGTSAIVLIPRTLVAHEDATGTVPDDAGRGRAHGRPERIENRLGQEEPPAQEDRAARPEPAEQGASLFAPPARPQTPAPDQPPAQADGSGGAAALDGAARPGGPSPLPRRVRTTPAAPDRGTPPPAQPAPAAPPVQPASATPPDQRIPAPAQAAPEGETGAPQAGRPGAAPEPAGEPAGTAPAPARAEGGSGETAGQDSPAPQRGVLRSGVERARVSITNGTYNGLPRRVRQASLAPQLRNRPLSAPTPAGGIAERPPEQVRALFSAIQRGAQRGRAESQDPSGSASADHVQDTYREKGDE